MKVHIIWALTTWYCYPTDVLHWRRMRICAAIPFKCTHRHLNYFILQKLQNLFVYWFFNVYKYTYI